MNLKLINHVKIKILLWGLLGLILFSACGMDRSDKIEKVLFDFEINEFIDYSNIRVWRGAFRQEEFSYEIFEMIVQNSEKFEQIHLADEYVVFEWSGGELHSSSNNRFFYSVGGSIGGKFRLMVFDSNEKVLYLIYATGIM